MSTVSFCTILSLLYESRHSHNVCKVLFRLFFIVFPVIHFLVCFIWELGIVAAKMLYKHFWSLIKWILQKTSFVFCCNTLSLGCFTCLFLLSFLYPSQKEIYINRKFHLNKVIRCLIQLLIWFDLRGFYLTWLYFLWSFFNCYLSFN